MAEWKTARYWRNRSKDERLANANIPARYRSSTLAGYDTDYGSDKAHKACEKWLGSFEKYIQDGFGISFCGPTGSGKTHLACALLSEVVYNNELCGYFVTADKYIEMCYDAMRNDGELPDMYKDSNVMKYLRSIYDVVVIDGLGWEKSTDFTRKEMTTLIEARYENQLTTIITTHMKIDELATVYNNKLHSILKDSTFCVPVIGKDYRLKDFDNAGE